MSSLRQTRTECYPSRVWMSCTHAFQQQTLRRISTSSPITRRLIDHLARKLGVTEVDTSSTRSPSLLLTTLVKLPMWYEVSRQAVIRNGGKDLFDRFGSLGAALQATYPEHPWQQDLFLCDKTSPRLYWNTTRLRSLADSIGKKLGITEVKSSLSPPTI